MHENQISREVVECALQIHKTLGPGLLESAYEAALTFELRERGLIVYQQQALQFVYKEIRQEIGFRADIIVENKVLIEVKSVESLAPVHHAQLLTYLKLTGKKLGLLINFNVPLIKEGIHRMVNKL